MNILNNNNLFDLLEEFAVQKKKRIMVLTGECDIHLKIPQHYFILLEVCSKNILFSDFLVRLVAKESILSAKLIQL